MTPRPFFRLAGLTAVARLAPLSVPAANAAQRPNDGEYPGHGRCIARRCDPWGPHDRYAGRAGDRGGRRQRLCR
jgi:hypothetical protein